MNNSVPLPHESHWPERKFVPVIVVLVALLAAIIFWLSHRIEIQKKKDLANSLETVLKMVQDGLRIWSQDVDADTTSLAKSKSVWGIVEALEQIPYGTHFNLRRPLVSKLKNALMPSIKEHHYLRYSVIQQDGTQVAPEFISSVERSNIYREDQKTIQLALHGTFAIGTPFVMNESHSNSPLGDLPRVIMIAATPVLNDEGKVIAALVFYLDPSRRFTSMAQMGRLGTTGETYAISKNGQMITQSRFGDQLKQNVVALIELRDPGGAVINGSKPFTQMAQSVMNKHSGLNLDGYHDYRGEEVIGAWLWDDELGFGLATEIDKKEAYQSFDMIQRLTWLMLAAIILGGMVILWILRVEARMRQISYANEQANRARREILAMVSHDLKNPLTAILLNADILIKTIPVECEMKDSRLKLLNSMRDAMQRMNRLVGDLQLETKLGIGNLEMRLQQLESRNLINELILLYSPLAKEKDIRLIEKLSNGPLPFCGDKNKNVSDFFKYNR